MGFNIVCQESQLRQLADIKPAELEGAWVGMFNVPFTPSHTDALATYLGKEANFAGYARQQVVGWLAPVLLGGIAFTLSPLVTFTSTDVATTGNYGYFLCSVNAGYVGNLVMGATFAAPINISNVLPPIAFAIPYTLQSEF